MRGIISQLQGYECHLSWKQAVEKSAHGLHGGCDVAEVFSVPRVTDVAESCGLVAGDSYDLHLGDDLLLGAERQRVLTELRRDDPFCVVVSPPSTVFSRKLPKNLSSEEQQKAKNAMTLLVFGVVVCREQLGGGTSCLSSRWTRTLGACLKKGLRAERSN